VRTAEYVPQGVRPDELPTAVALLSRARWRLAPVFQMLAASKRKSLGALEGQRSPRLAKGAGQNPRQCRAASYVQLAIVFHKRCERGRARINRDRGVKGLLDQGDGDASVSALKRRSHVAFVAGAGLKTASNFSPVASGQSQRPLGRSRGEFGLGALVAEATAQPTDPIQVGRGEVRPRSCPGPLANAIRRCAL